MAQPERDRGLLTRVATDEEYEALAGHARELGAVRWAWLVGFAFDVPMLALVWPRASWAWVLGLRALGAPVLPLLRAMASAPRVPARVTGPAVLASSYLLVAIMCLQASSLGGLTSPYVFSVMVYCLGAPLVATVRVRLLAGVMGSWLALWTALLLLVSLRDRELAAQWGSPSAVALYAAQWAFVLGIFAAGLRTATQIASLRRELAEARKLAGYRLKVRLGVGGMNEVWLAWDERARRDVALKVLQRAPSDEARRRFEREAESTRALTSPHTVRVLDFGASDDGVMFLAMERLDGLDLDRLVRAYGPLPPARAVALARQACRSLAEAHALSIVHRDVKPSNLFLTRGDRLKVLDFGVAHRGDLDETRITREGLPVGTPHYMAPEAFRAERPDPSVDIYGLGATLYYLVTGARPFDGASGWHLAEAVLHTPPAAPSTRAPRAIPAALDALILACLAKSPGERPRDIASLDEALAALERDAPWRPEDALRWWEQVSLPPVASSPSETTTLDGAAHTPKRRSAAERSAGSPPELRFGR